MSISQFDEKPLNLTCAPDRWTHADPVLAELEFDEIERIEFKINAVILS